MRSPVSLRAIFFGLLIALVAANMWPVLLLKLGVSLAADSPRDFVDEWNVSPWEQAAQWSSKAAAKDLRKTHTILSNRRDADNPLLEYDSAHRCSDSPDHYQVEIVEEVGPEFRSLAPSESCNCSDLSF